jgi:hypothetical protein
MVLKGELMMNADNGSSPTFELRWKDGVLQQKHISHKLSIPAKFEWRDVPTDGLDQAGIDVYKVKFRWRQGKLQKRHNVQVSERRSAYEWRNVPNDDLPMTGHAPSPPPKIEPWDDPEFFAFFHAPIWARKKVLDLMPPWGTRPLDNEFRAKLAEALERVGIGYSN